MSPRHEAETAKRPSPAKRRDALTNIEDLPILFVDDEQDVLKALRRTVSSRGWRIEEAISAKAALQLVDKQDFAVVVSDFRMPDMDGVHFLAQVRERSPTTERILLTAYADTEALERGINEAGITRFLRKPWRREVLVNVLEQAVSQSRMLREHAILTERLRNRNEELLYLNQLLRDSVEESARAIVGFRRRWDAALNAISDALIIVNPALSIEGANDAVARLTGRPLEEIEGRLCHEMLFERTRPCDGCPIETGEGRVRRTVGKNESTFDVRAYRLPGSPVSHICVYRDITREIAFQMEAAHMEKMAAIGRLAGSVAHEINNPLHGILSFVQLAEKPGVTSEKLERYHEVIRECAIRCRDIVQSLGSFTRRSSSAERGPVDLGEVCRKAMVLFENVDNAQLHCEDLPEGVRCMGNANQLQQVMVNLIQNGVDASPEAGRIQVTVTAERDEVVVAVDDDGDGIPQDERERIFEPFYTTKPEGVGTGLGLAISHSIMREHGGTLRVVDGVLRGARFEMRLPILKEENQRESSDE